MRLQSSARSQSENMLPIEQYKVNVHGIQYKLNIFILKNGTQFDLPSTASTCKVYVYQSGSCTKEQFEHINSIPL